MNRFILVCTAAIALAACSEPKTAEAPAESAAPAGPPAYAPADGRALLSLTDLSASAAGAGAQYIKQYEETGPAGAVPAIFAHAPMSMLVVVPAGAQDLAVNFGMKQESWAETKGVCFSIRAGKVNGATTEIFKRCLKPGSVETDKGMQEAIVPLAAGVEAISFQTDPAATSEWSWAYWAAPRITP